MKNAEGIWEESEDRFPAYSHSVIRGLVTDVLLQSGDFYQPLFGGFQLFVNSVEVCGKYIVACPIEIAGIVVIPASNTYEIG